MVAATKEATPDVPATNGTEHAGPSLKRVEEWYDLEPFEFPGFKMKMWLGFTQEWWTEFLDADEQKTRAMLRSVILEHNGWRDANDQPFPSAQAEDFIDKLPRRIASMLVTRITDEVNAPPKSPRPTRPR